MNKTEQALLHALKELDQTVKQMPQSTEKPDLVSRFARIDDLVGQLPQGTDPALLHCLYKKSYQKALLHLENQAKLSQT